MSCIENNFDKATSALNTAKTMTADRLIRFANYGPYIHAEVQIDLIERILIEKRRPTQHEMDQADIALMAIKEFDSLELAYSAALCELSFSRSYNSQ
jgi:hypothetical protein